MQRAKRQWPNGLILGFIALSAWVAQASSNCPAPVDLTYSVVAHQAHSKHAFTQGLLFADGQLVESTGLYGRSKLIVHRPKALSIALPSNRFGEGVAWFDQKLWQLSWKAGELRSYNLQLELLDIWRYPGEGWGLSHDGDQFIMSDGSASLSLRRSSDFAETQRILVRSGDQTVSHINELEWIEGQLFANIWQQDRVARIDTNSGCVTGWLALDDLWPRMIRPPFADVLNGIAWNAETRELWVTGKNWPRLYRLKIHALAQATP